MGAPITQRGHTAPTTAPPKAISPRPPPAANSIFPLSPGLVSFFSLSMIYINYFIVLRAMTKHILDVKGLHVEVEGKTLIDGVDISLERKESYVLFGPNGSGKTSLVSAIMGLPEYRITRGRIVFDGVDVTKKSIDERSRLGMKLAFQLPPEIVGVKLRDMLKVCMGLRHDDELPDKAHDLAEKLRLSEFLDRDINLGFSGGERKRAEALQMLLMEPKLMLLDEPDSGVDAESLKLIGSLLNDYLKKSGSSALIITHQGQILDYLHARKSCVFMKKIIYCMSSPQEILSSIHKGGYSACLDCDKRMVQNE
jgi:Fe-S cluster assembly ATP-binding protein